MRRKNKKKIHFSFLRNTIMGLLVIFVLALSYKKSIMFLERSNYFMIKDISYDPVLPLAKSRTLTRLKGKNLFSVDLNYIQNKLQKEYPGISNLKITKKFPDQIRVVAEKRIALFQAMIKKQVVTIDNQCVVLATGDDKKKDLPFVIGVRNNFSSIKVGRCLKDRRLQLALKLIKSFRENQTLATYPIAKIDINNLSKIYLFLSNELKIILDEDIMPSKIKQLGLLLVQNSFDFKQVKYVDLRFKQPILGGKQF